MFLNKRKYTLLICHKSPNLLCKIIKLIVIKQIFENAKLNIYTN